MYNIESRNQLLLSLYSFSNDFFNMIIFLIIRVGDRDTVYVEDEKFQELKESTSFYKKV